ncbi:lymphocyte antigen 6K [Lycaon pictus]
MSAVALVPLGVTSPSEPVCASGFGSHLAQASLPGRRVCSVALAAAVLSKEEERAWWPSARGWSWALGRGGLRALLFTARLQHLGTKLHVSAAPGLRLRQLLLQAQAPREMMILLALLLLVDLPRVETNVTVSGTQGLLRCHVCEKENTFACRNPTQCAQGVRFCASVAVRVYPCFFYVSKQWSKKCPTVEQLGRIVKSFVLIKPMPFLYTRCCSDMLRNTEAPEIWDPGFRQSGRASDVRSSSAWLVPLLMLSPGLAGLRLP